MDFLFLALLVLAFWRGWKKGLVMALLAVVAVVLGSMIALRMGSWLASMLFPDGGGRWAPLLCYILMFIGVVLLVRYLGKMLESGLRMIMLGWANRIMGGLLYALTMGLVLSAIIYLGLGAGLLQEQQVAESMVGSRLQPLAPWLFANMGDVLPFIKSSMDSLRQLFDSAPDVATP